MTDVDVGKLSADEKRVLLADLLAQASAREALRPMKPLAANAPRPLSFAQERLWFLHRLNPGSPLYNISLGLRLNGPLDEGMLRRAVEVVVARHDTLRTSFSEVGGVPTQVVASAATGVVEAVDLSGAPDAERDVELHRHLVESARRPFDLAAAPLVRLLHVRLAPDDHVVIMTMHHIVSDAWSIAIFARETIASYEGLTGAAPVELAPLPVQYADFASWQRDELASPMRAREVSFWREYLAGAQPLRLPTDRPRPALPSLEGGRERFSLSEPRTEALRTFCRDEKATLFTVVLAAFEVVLAHWSGQRDIVIGTPVSNRGRSEIENVIGVFVNTVVLRTRLDDETSFRTLVAQVRDGVATVSAHQSLPFEQVVEALDVERRLDRTPLFQVLFVAPQGPLRGLELADRDVTLVDVHSGTAKFDLALSLVDRGHAVELYLEHRLDLFDEPTVAGMLHHLDVLLEAALATPELPVSRLRLLRPEERRMILENWSGSAAPPRRVDPAHVTFAERCRTEPDSVAAFDLREQMTYADLDRRAEQIAAQLSARGVGEGDVVAVALPRSVDLLASAIALWRLGATYLPLAPDSPAERATGMVHDAGAELAVLERGRPETDMWGVATLVLGDAPVTAAPPAVEPSLERTAYVFFTSGSTGGPKGVTVDHGSLARYLAWCSEALWANRIDLMPAIADPSFDASLKQLFAPLVHRGRVWLLPPSTARDPVALLGALATRTDRVALNCVPTIWRSVLDVLDSGCPLPPSLREIVLSGDVVSQELVVRTASTCPGLSLYNVYGPTEATANAAAGQLAPDEPVTIGRPIEGVRLFVLDEQGEPVPPGVPGTLHVGGHNLSSGYLGRPQESAARFPEHPLLGRLFDTGDVARHLPDGRLQFLGRRDDQVQVGGVRVELGEVREAVASHPRVSEVAVRAQPLPGGHRLVAYVVAKDHDELGAALRAHLVDRVPQPMLPTVVTLPALPRLTSGKVDVDALDRLGIPEADATPRRPPANAAERQLVSIWRELLGHDIGVHDNVFDAGGTSLMMLRAQAMIRVELGLEVPVVELFRHPTVAALALHLSGGHTTAPDPRLDRAASTRTALDSLRAKSQGR